MPEPVQRPVFQVSVVGVVEPVASDDVIVLRLDRGLIILLIPPRPREVDAPRPGPLFDVLVEEFRPVIEVQTSDLKRDLTGRGLQPVEIARVRVIAHRAGERPFGVEVSEIEGAGEFSGLDGPQWTTVSPSKNPGSS